MDKIVRSFYNYFNNKKELLFEHHHRHAERVHRCIRAVSEPSKWKRLKMR
ncbi:MAG: hypothetical protein GY854_04560 [Deltaproteobacteria bacterium]|nr:hypothetical protein [Deltaproteobacteria bacterium]